MSQFDPREQGLHPPESRPAAPGEMPPAAVPQPRWQTYAGESDPLGETVEFNAELAAADGWIASPVDAADREDPDVAGVDAADREDPDVAGVDAPDPDDSMAETVAPTAAQARRAALAQGLTRIRLWVTGADRYPDLDDEGPLAPAPAPARPPLDEVQPTPARGRFPVSPLGYERGAVDDHLAELEDELAELRGRIDPPVSITEELERIGEQTASILVVAHDQANETARLARQQADRCVAAAAASAVALTADSERRLRELDDETDVVWRERERLLDDVRALSQALTALADEAGQRFPAAPEPIVGAGSLQRASAAPEPIVGAEAAEPAVDASPPPGP